MKSTLNHEMTGREIIERFERILPPEQSFRHADHVRLAFEFLRACPVLEALNRFSNALKRFAEARGKPQLYHETITFAYLFLIRERMAAREGLDWEEFSSQNADLLTWRNGILESYYREGTLKSDLARRVFILPDKLMQTDAQTSPVDVESFQR